jgi:hypothetical protein
VAGFIPDALPVISDIVTTDGVQEIIVSWVGPYGPHVIKGIGVVVILARVRGKLKGN